MMQENGMNDAMTDKTSADLQNIPFELFCQPLWLENFV